MTYLERSLFLVFLDCHEGVNDAVKHAIVDCLSAVIPEHLQTTVNRTVNRR